MSTFTVLAVLGAALLHATWNAIAHGVDDRLVGFAVMGVVDVVGGGVLIALGDPLPATAWPLVVSSAAAHVLYNLLLLAGYQLGEFSQVYPLARGTAPLVVCLVSVLALGRSLLPQQLLGVLAVSTGIIGLVLIGGRFGRGRRPAIAAAFATGLMIALYTVIDAVGVGGAPVLAYAGWLFLLQGPPLVVLAVVRRRGRLSASLRRSAVPALAGGVISLAAYGIVLWAQTSGALASVAALRETSVLFGALIGAAFLGERLGYRRAGAAAVILVGVLALSV